MGRRDAVQVTLEIVARCRFYLPQLLVTWEPGWETRGNGTRCDYEFNTVHHTASASSLARPFPTQNILRDGRPGLSGPLCNSAGPACTVESPRLHINSANPANHAGASRRSGPVPALSLFNPKSWGHEIDYAGSAPMLAGQMLVALVVARATADVLAGGNVEHARAHAETSVTGKWDPGYAPGRTIDMAAFRRDAASLIPGGSEVVTNAEIDAIADRVWFRGQTHGAYKGLPPIIALFDTRSAGPGDTAREVQVALGPAVTASRDAAVAVRDALPQLAGAVPPGQVVQVDVAQMMAHFDYARFAEALAAVQNRQARDGDPATGPVS